MRTLPGKQVRRRCSGEKKEHVQMHGSKRGHGPLRILEKFSMQSMAGRGGRRADTPKPSNALQSSSVFPLSKGELNLGFFFTASITSYHQLSGLKPPGFIILQFWRSGFSLGQKSKGWQVTYVPSGGSQGDQFFAYSFLEAAHAPWFPSLSHLQS